MKTVFIINGYAGVGKDTFVNMCGQYCKILNISSVDKIKEVAYILGWNGTKDEKSRKFLSDLKLLSTDYNQFPFEYLKNTIRDFYQKHKECDLMFLHIREPEEIEKLKKEFPDVVTLLVENVNVEQVTSNMADENVFNYHYEITIKNNSSLGLLNEKAKAFVEKYI